MLYVTKTELMKRNEKHFVLIDVEKDYRAIWTWIKLCYILQSLLVNYKRVYNNLYSVS